MAGKIDLSIPRAPSPFIRACRWSAFIVGIFIGNYQLKRYRKIEENFQKQQAPLKAKLAQKLADHKGAEYRAGMASLYREATGKDFPADVEL